MRIKKDREIMVLDARYDDINRKTVRAVSKRSKKKIYVSPVDSQGKRYVYEVKE